jgi:hypothetical protein
MSRELKNIKLLSLHVGAPLLTSVCLFFLINASATFQRAMQITFDDLISKIIQNYLDDLIVYSNTRKYHFDHLRQVFLRSIKFGMSLNPTKSILGVTAEKILKHIISDSSINIDLKRVISIQNIQAPSSNHSWVRSISSEDLFLIFLEW